MIASRKILTATALVALGMTLTSLSSPFFGARAEAGQQVDPVSQRIDIAFAVVSGVPGGVEMQQMTDARKGDLKVSPACAGQSWPAIAPDCLMKADGSAVRPVRMVTFGYESGPTTTVLVRMPSPMVASR